MKVDQCHTQPHTKSTLPLNKTLGDVACKAKKKHLTVFYLSVVDIMAVHKSQEESQEIVIQKLWNHCFDLL